ncbi:MAG: hypothetical protein A3J28_09805 [Acidobacteria bacterium RIFCSPLOWO2_12_FULL_60_22]|nr:MAG: hypothetical protein A3J28_09805 [Acidobacteria bacterium RIFCSPLOWO2_12_FULL_60_22]
MAEVVVIEWKRYRDFFNLWTSRGSEPQLIHVIGECHHCYVGSVGSKGGSGGLRVRYEKQYLDRARAIFGRQAPDDQPAFAGIFQSGTYLDGRHIRAAEAQVQQAFVARFGATAALFKPEQVSDDIEFRHVGEVPDFLKRSHGGELPCAGDAPPRPRERELN